MFIGKFEREYRRVSAGWHRHDWSVREHHEPEEKKLWLSANDDEMI
jgi:hypothetical protein